MIYLAYALALIIGLGFVGHWSLGIVLALLWARAVIRAGMALPRGDYRSLGAEQFARVERGISRRILDSALVAGLLYLVGRGIAWAT